MPNKERQIEALQLLLLLLPQANRSLLKLLLDLLYHTAKQQDKNKMSAYNLALMFAPHVLWPRHVSFYFIGWQDSGSCSCQQFVLSSFSWIKVLRRHVLWQVY